MYQIFHRLQKNVFLTEIKIYSTKESGRTFKNTSVFQRIFRKIVWRKISRNQPRVLFTFYTGRHTKILPFSKILGFWSKNRQVALSNLSNSYVFLDFKPKVIYQNTFFHTSNSTPFYGRFDPYRWRRLRPLAVCFLLISKFWFRMYHQSSVLNVSRDGKI